MYLCLWKIEYIMPMEEKFIYTDKERELSEQILESLKKALGETFYENDLPKLREHLSKVVSDNSIQRLSLIHI